MEGNRIRPAQSLREGPVAGNIRPAVITLDLFEAPQQLAEPRATVLQGRRVEYVLKRSVRRRRIVFSVDEHGLVVDYPGEFRRLS